jgi:predicted negative regulator of RcsB-dependent stress response
MEETYTYYDDLVQFLYHEMPAGEAVEMAHLIEEDPGVQAMFQTLQLAKTQLPKVQFNPSQAVLNNILQYSTKTALEARL